MSTDSWNDELIASVKGFHRSFPTGVTIVTTTSEGLPYGLAVNAFSSISLTPPMVLVCVNSSSSTYQRLFSNDEFGVSILASDQAGVAQVFAKSGAQKFEQITWTPGKSGAPLIDGAAAQLEFRVKSRLLAGTHTIFVGIVTAAQSFGRPSLIYSAGEFYDGGQLAKVAAKPQGA